MKPLTPVDRARCQADVTPAHGFMVLGPRPRPARCPNPAALVATETAPGKDGRVGAMSLCRSCLMVFLASPEAQGCRVEELPP